MTPQDDGGWILPAEIDPPRRCVQIYVPDTYEHRAAFTGAVYELTRWFNWHRDDSHKARLVAAVWAEVFRDMIALMDSDNPCPCEEDMTDCCEDLLARLDTIIALLGQSTPSERDRQETITDIQQKILDDGLMTINPKTPDLKFDLRTGDSGGEILALRRRAICAWLTAWQESFQNDPYLIAGVGGIIPGAVLLFGTGVGLLAPLLTFGLFVVAAGAMYAIINDAQAKRDWVCCMADALEDMDPTRVNLEAAAGTCDTGGNTSVWSQVFLGTIATDEVLAALMSDLGTWNERLEAGWDVKCICDVDDGLFCDQAGTVVGIDLPAAGGSGWVPDALGGSCAGFGTILLGGGTFTGATGFCVHTVQLQRFFGGTSSGEATLARLTIGAAVYYEPIVANQHCTFNVDPHCVIGPTIPFRIDLLGGGEKMCHTGVRFTGVAIP